MKRMPISADTAVKLAAFMNVPLEHLMHMPQHIMLQKLAEMAMADAAQSQKKDETVSGEKPPENP
ncbi:YycC family protein [Cohnella candidum]|uniref:YycC family protein n=1 Tax=Cohnella candidum TaxID=2674991 RepID=A0A3G3JUC4_9BACL|nr:YycC family protein [Cohnella candidum]AYQ71835.1 YycC family protein [Cohnella candidum]